MPGIPEARFVRAQPVWVAGREREMNLQVGFRAVVPGGGPTPLALRLTASSVYRATVNGEFVGYGPARAAHGFFRVDEWGLEPWLRPGPNVVGIEVAGYNVASYYLLDQPAFLQAEVVARDAVLAATADGNDAFAAVLLPYRVQRVARYSFQRTFTEAYRMGPESQRWRDAPELPSARPLVLAIQPGGELLPRGAPPPDFAVVPARAVVARGEFTQGPPLAQPWRPSYLTQAGSQLPGYLEAELEEHVLADVEGLACRATWTGEKPAGPLRLTAGQWCILDLGCNLTGFIRISAACRQGCRLLLAFDELLEHGDVDHTRLGCVNLVSYRLTAGEYVLETFEPYALRYLKLLVAEGECELREVGLRLYVCPDAGRAEFRCSDPRLERVFEAGRETFRQNALDVFMDCPHRERAGWLCDSFFTARAEATLTGDSRIERSFLENFALPARFPDLPDGMLPMCYPADFRDGRFIPNWAMWFVIELAEYLDRTGDRDLVACLRPRVMDLLAFLARFENEHGLLEKLPSWVFVEWSAANDFVQEVNYPTNMVYAGMLDAAARLYGQRQFREQAEALRETIRRRSFDGEFFVDNALRETDGSLVETRNRTEACQYYAFFFDVATLESHPRLWEILVRDFGPDRQGRGLHPEVHPANAFIGNMLRLEALARAGLAQEVLDESVARLHAMGERTGTLWENTHDRASCNHGFASHVCHAFIRDLVGVRVLDRAARRVRLRFPAAALEWCEGSMPTPEGPIRVSWRQRGANALAYSISAPPGYDVEVEHTPGLQLEQDSI